MRYLLLICDDETASQALSPEEMAALKAEYMAVAGDMDRQGVLRGAERLRPTAEATTVRVRDGRTFASDGPFAETKEQIAGYFLVDCQDLDEAIEMAARLPAARTGTVEVRPIWEM